MSANSSGLENNQTGKLNAGAPKKRPQIYDVPVDMESGDKIVNIDTNNCEPLRYKTSKQQIKKPKYVQISVESYSLLTGLEDQVTSLEEQVNGLEDEVKDLDEKLSAAQLEMTNKENLAESEAATLKNYLESVTLLKLTAEDRASHLDGALKECMRKIRNLKEEHEQKLHDVIQNKAKQFEKMKHEFEAKIANLDQQLLRSAAENSALSSSLQERSSMVIKLSEKKSQAEAEIEIC
ncbi:hypothetical protein KY290_023489 [Solanum tuberosum]|uniref:Uncharacterized protein n=1 Tax=Solanum tuberosum TaxID=4113 RepID=A0ABQ7V986_SOLTU|nr:hypothetical protein KY290_023489 [Solanum tuberosum]